MSDYEKGSALIESLLTVPIFMSIIYGTQIFLSNSSRFSKDTMAELSLAQSINLFSQEEINNSNWAIVNNDSLGNEINTLWNSNKLWNNVNTNTLDTTSNISECRKKNIMYNESNKEKNGKIDIKTCAEYEAYDDLSDTIKKDNKFIKNNFKFTERDLKISSIYRPNNMFDYQFREFIGVDAHFSVENSYKNNVSNTSTKKELLPFNGGYFMQSEQIKGALMDIYFKSIRIQYITCLLEAESRYSGSNPYGWAIVGGISIVIDIANVKNPLCPTTNNGINTLFNIVKKAGKVRISSLKAVENLSKMKMNIANIKSKTITVPQL